MWQSQLSEGVQIINIDSMTKRTDLYNRNLTLLSVQSSLLEEVQSIVLKDKNQD